MEVIKLINYLIAVIFCVCYSYQLFYLLVPFLWKEKAHKAIKKNKFAILISARNEEKVIGNLIENYFISVGDWNYGSAISLIMAMVIIISMYFTKKADKKVGGEE